MTDKLQRPDVDSLHPKQTLIKLWVIVDYFLTPNPTLNLARGGISLIQHVLNGRHASKYAEAKWGYISAIRNRSLSNSSNFLKNKSKQFQ